MCVERYPVFYSQDLLEKTICNNILKNCIEGRMIAFPRLFSAIDWEYMRLGEDHYLIVSNAQNGGEGQQLLSMVYRWQGVERFVPVHAMATLPNADLDAFSDGDNVYVVSASAKSATSQLLRVKFV